MTQYWDPCFGWQEYTPWPREYSQAEIAEMERVRKEREAADFLAVDMGSLAALRSWLEEHRDEPLSGFRKRKNYGLLDLDTVARRFPAEGGPQPIARKGTHYNQLVNWDRAQPADQPRTGADFLAALDAMIDSPVIMVEGESYSFPLEGRKFNRDKYYYVVARANVNGELFPVRYNASIGTYGSWIMVQQSEYDAARYAHL